ncbi:hypothetical protein HOK51_02075 [Candidatus Woesearchaeota archaeon]|jgi:hypothetical protein|nr:hypothetical protein [Candidatus Woesearchaeota archaeon]MBT6518603.1 hypothetical protein [Candidatus Woesearchaeota archaeon]MBT7368757.1 hypothetical protein [Candidatus Woesearchaeota archaeon]
MTDKIKEKLKSEKPPEPIPTYQKKDIQYISTPIDKKTDLGKLEVMVCKDFMDWTGDIKSSKTVRDFMKNFASVKPGIVVEAKSTHNEKDVYYLNTRWDGRSKVKIPTGNYTITAILDDKSYSNPSKHATVYKGKKTEVTFTIKKEDFQIEKKYT